MQYSLQYSVHNILHLTKSYREFSVWVINQLIDAICSPYRFRGGSTILTTRESPFIQQAWAIIPFISHGFGVLGEPIEFSHFNKDEIGDFRNVDPVSIFDKS